MSSIAYSAVSGALALTAVGSFYQATNVKSSKTNVLQSALNVTIGTATNQAAQKQRQQIETLFYSALGVASGAGSVYSMAQVIDSENFLENFTSLLTAAFGKEEPPKNWISKFTDFASSSFPRTCKFITETYTNFTPRQTLNAFLARIEDTMATAGKQSSTKDAAMTYASFALGEALSWIKFSLYHCFNAASYAASWDPSTGLGGIATLVSIFGSALTLPSYLFESSISWIQSTNEPVSSGMSNYLFDSVISQVQSISEPLSNGISYYAEQAKETAQSTLATWGLDQYLPGVHEEIAQDASSLVSDITGTLGTLASPVYSTIAALPSYGYSFISWSLNTLASIGTYVVKNPSDAVVDFAWGLQKHRFSILAFGVLYHKGSVKVVTNLALTGIFKPWKVPAALKPFRHF